MNANEWLNKKIPINQRTRATSLYINGQRSKCDHSDFTPGCKYCSNCSQINYRIAPTFEFYNTLNDFVNLQQLSIIGTKQDEQQKLTSLKIDKCNKLTNLTIYYTTLTKLNINENIMLQNVDISYNNLCRLNLDCKLKKLDRFNFIGNKELSFNDIRLKSQVEKLTSIIRNIKGVGLGDLKLAAKKIEEENLEDQLASTKNRMDKNGALLLELLLETHQELEKVKKGLSEVLTAEEIRDFLRKKRRNL
ncbi:9396_t:CDS:1 [Scutellospora calospora]|uniref:9396_t:CDS:1 n=1 Tax=Scutellospora calospora TaxID=85575 RepID=A0ACA9M8Y7_9GLOM|nr:9396_t:CDS:1 [Scutellospora calospora]